MPDKRALEYRQKADECRLEAARAFTESDKSTWLRMRDEWLALAHSVEEQTAIARTLADDGQAPQSSS